MIRVRMKHRKCLSKGADVERRLKWRLTEVSDVVFRHLLVNLLVICCAYWCYFMLFIHHAPPSFLRRDQI